MTGTDFLNLFAVFGEWSVCEAFYLQVDRHKEELRKGDNLPKKKSHIAGEEKL